MAAEQPEFPSLDPPLRIGKYEILAKIGQGAMGEVYKARDSVLNRLVAIKTMSAAVLSDANLNQRFLREAQSAARLNHPNIVTLLDFGEDQGRLFMAMELLEGEDLKQRLQSGTEETLEEKLRVIEQTLDGVAYAHAAGVVHRDLKPANIHAPRKGRTKVMDFGLARLGESEMTRTGTVMGSPNYMSPEQVRGQRAGPGSDVFALGSVFYELFAGRRAFAGESMHSILYQVTDMQPPPLVESCPDLPMILAAFVEKALEKEPGRRYADGAEMREALDLCRQVLDGRQDEDSAIALLLESQTVFEGHGDLPSAAGVSLPPTLSGSATTDRGTQRAIARTGGRPASGSRRVASGSVRSGQPAENSAPPSVLSVAGAPRGLYAGVAVVAILMLGGLAYLLWRSQVPVPRADDGAARALVTVALQSQVEVARKSMELKDLHGAIAAASRALQLDGNSPEAQEVLARAKAALEKADQAARAAREAAAAGDNAAASRALAQVLALAPRHPVIGELSARLDSSFQAQADEATRGMKREAAAARGAKAMSFPEYAEAMRLAGTAEGLYARRQYTEAAQQFEEARRGFAAARGAALEASRAPAATAPSPPRPVASVAPAPSPTLAAPAPTVPATLPSPPPTPAPTPAAPSAPPATRPARPAVTDDAAVRDVVGRFARAIEQKDLTLYKELRPGLSGEEERRLRDAFQNVASQQVEFAIDSISIERDEATVRVMRSGSVSGRAVPPQKQVLRLERRQGSWVIREIGQ